MGSHLKGAAARARFRHITAIIGQRCAVMTGIDWGANMSQHGFKRLSTVAAWANSLAFVALTSNVAASENLPPVPAAYQSSATCDQGAPGGEFVVGVYKYRLSHEIFPPSVDLSHKFRKYTGVIPNSPIGTI